MCRIMETFWVLILAFIYFHFANCISLRGSYFVITPSRPLINEDVNVTCRLIAPIGKTFYRTEPWITFDDNSEETYAPSRVGKEHIPGVDTDRFSTDRSPDINRISVGVTVLIKNFSMEDVGMNIACVGRLHLGGNDYEDVRVSGVLRIAAPPPPPTNLLISFPTNAPITCQSPLLVTWGRVNISMTDRNIEGYRVQVKGDNEWRILTSSLNNTSILTDRNCSAIGETIQAEINCWSIAGNSSTVVSNRIHLYYPEIQNLTVHDVETSHRLHIKWTFSDPTHGWLLDIRYRLTVYYDCNHKVNSFTDEFNLLSNISQLDYGYQVPPGSRITLVLLTKLQICSQDAQYPNMLFSSPSENITSTPTIMTPTTQPPQLNTSQSTMLNSSQLPNINTNSLPQMVTQLLIVFSSLFAFLFPLIIALFCMTSIICCLYMFSYKNRNNQVQDRRNPDAENGPDLIRPPRPLHQGDAG